MAEKETEMQERTDVTQRRRSPSWPFIPLSKGLDRVREFYKVHRDKAAALSAANVSWSMTPKSGAGGQTIGTLKQYGLMRQAESGGVQLTDLALRIVRDTREFSPDREDLIRQAAIKPKIFSEMWEKWDEGIPDDADVLFYLVQERQFNEDAAKGILANYKATIRFAKLSLSDSVGDNATEQGAPHNDPVIRPVKPPNPSSTRLMEGERIVFTHEVEPEHGVRIVASGAVDEELIDAVEMFLELQKKRLGLVSKKPKDKAA